MSEFARIFSPKTERAVKAISLLTNGPRYKPTEEETAHTLQALKEAVDDIAKLYGVLPEGDIIVKGVDEPRDTTMTESLVEASRIDAKMEILKRSPFAHGKIFANVEGIPEEQLTNYATHILARLCAKFEEPEIQPKNYEPKED